MKQRRLVNRASVQILDCNGTEGKQRLDIRNDQGRGGNHLGAAHPPPDLDEVALARANRPGKQHGPSRPIGPGVD
jgi:hypothetical protein